MPLSDSGKLDRTQRRRSVRTSDTTDVARLIGQPSERRKSESSATPDLTDTSSGAPSEIVRTIAAIATTSHVKQIVGSKAELASCHLPAASADGRRGVEGDLTTPFRARDPSSTDTAVTTLNGCLIQPPTPPVTTGASSVSKWALSPAQQRKQMVTDVLQALDRMEATVNDVLDFRKLDANMFSMSRKPVVVRDLIDSVCRHCRPFLKAHVQFGYRVSPADAVAMIDHRRMFQIIINGLSNAGKFTNSGAVAVDVTLNGGGVGVPQYLVVTVSNTSDEAKLKDPEALFVPFRGTHEGATPAAAGELSIGMA